MKTFKSFIALIALLLCNTSIIAHDFEVDGIYYNITSSTGKTVEVTYKGTNSGSYSNEYTGSISIPKSVAYGDATYFVTCIGKDAFYNCTGVTSVSIPNSVTSIGDWAFSICEGLTSITIPNSITSIGDYAFNACGGLTSLSIPNSVTSIGDCVFRYCDGLTEVTIGNGLKNIGEGAFCQCSALASVHISDIAAWCNIDFDYFDSNPLFYAHHLYLNGEKIKDLVIPNNVKNIGDYTFGSCSDLMSVVIGDDVTNIGYQAFSACSGLTSITLGNSVTNIGNQAFEGCSGLTSIVIPNSVKSIGKYAFWYCTDLTSVTIGDGVTSIGDRAFDTCSGLTSVIIGNSVTSIGESAFSGCSYLTSVSIPNSVTSIGDRAFSGCDGLTEVTIGNGVTSIGGYAFAYCDGLKSITSFIAADKLFAPGNNSFYYVDKTNCILYVPKGSKETYTNTDGWKEFTNIVEFLETYKVTYVIDGEVLATDSIKEGCSLQYPDVPEKEGYTFLWDTNTEVMPSNDVTITGKYHANIYAVNYVVDGDTLATDSVVYGSVITLREEAVKEGHTFSGWSEVPATMPAGDVTVTGSFTVNTYTVSYVVDGEVIESYPVEYGKELVMMPLLPEKEGYTFIGWSDMPATMPAEDVTITATFKVNTYALNYIVDGETFAVDSVKYGSTIALRGEPIKEGHTFSGWSVAPETMPAANVTITGSFAINTYAITYIIDGETIATDSLDYGSAIALLEEPTREGYTFSGWSETPAMMPAEDVTVTGTWSINSYLVVYIIDGEVYATDSVEYGAEIVLPEVPEKENSTFEWGDVPATMPAKSVIIYGNYTSGIEDLFITRKVDVYTLKGMLYKRDVEPTKLRQELPTGIYIIEGKKYLVK